MKQKNSYNHLLLNASVIYVVAVLLYQILYIIIPFQFLFSISYLRYYSSALAVIGFGLLALNLLINRPFLNWKNCLLPLCMLITLTISSLIHYRYGLVNNAKNLIWQSVQMLLIVTVVSQKSHVNWKQIIKGIFLFVALILTISNIISFYQYFHMIGYNVYVNSYELRQGFMEGRLFGLYSNPYESGVISILMAMMAVYYFTKEKSLYARIGYILFAMQSFVMATLGSARTIVVAFAVTAFFLGLCIVLHKSTLKKISNMPIRIIAGIASGVIACGVVLGAFSITHNASVELAVQVQNAIPQIEDDTPELDNITPSESANTNKPAKPSGTLRPQENDKIESQYAREDVDEGNISNNRFQIWGDYFTVMMSNPTVAIFGASPGGYMQYIFQNHKDLYIVSHMIEYYPNMIAHQRIYDTHNAYVSALISGGILTTVFLAVFLINLVIKCLKQLYRQERLSTELLLQLSILCFLLVASFFSTDLFFKCTFSSIIFWMNYGFICRKNQDRK